MPLYSVKCQECGHEMEVFRNLRNWGNWPECCGHEMRQVLTPTNIMPDIQPYKSMIDGRMITSRSEHREHLKANNCIEVGNEKPKPRKSERSKADREAFRQELADRLECIRQ